MPQGRNIINERFGMLVVIKKSEKVDNRGRSFYECQCDCGNICTVSRDNLVRNHTKSCGCMRGKHRLLTLADFQKQYENDPHNITPIKEIGNDLLMHCNNCHYEFLVNRQCARNYFRNCPCCGDGVSYPNKFLRNFILQLPIDDYKFEYRDNWSQGKIYDVYFSYQNQKYLVEIDGEQHHRDTLYHLEEEQKQNDLLKEKLAKEADFIFIRIDASLSSSEYIINQIQQSLFNKIFDLTQIDWNKCEENSIKSIIIEICKYFNENSCTGIDLSKHFNIGLTTVHRYLQKGSEIGLIDKNYKDTLESERVKKIKISKNSLLI